VTVTFTDGTTATGDFLIAADGSHSAVRPYVLGYTPERRYAGYVNWNGLVKIDEEIAPAHQWTTFVGEGKRVSLMPVSGGRFYFFLTCRCPRSGGRSHHPARRSHGLLPRLGAAGAEAYRRAGS
jgi:FAD-dependent urate hydroxylase